MLLAFCQLSWLLLPHDAPNVPGASNMLLEAPNAPPAAPNVSVGVAHPTCVVVHTQRVLLLHLLQPGAPNVLLGAPIGSPAAPIVPTVTPNMSGAWNCTWLEVPNAPPAAPIVPTVTPNVSGA